MPVPLMGWGEHPCTGSQSFVHGFPSSQLGGSLRQQPKIYRDLYINGYNAIKRADPTATGRETTRAMVAITTVP